MEELLEGQWCGDSCAVVGHHSTINVRKCMLKRVVYTSLVPRPHPLTRRNGLVNQVEFLGLAHTFATGHLATFKIFHAKPAQKRY